MMDMSILPGVTRDEIAEVLMAAADEFCAHPAPDGETILPLDLARGAWGRKSDGEVCDWSSPDAVAVCVVGAICRVEASRPRNWVLRTEVRRAVKAYLGAHGITHPYASIAQWSDVHLSNRHDASSFLVAVAHAVAVPF